MKYAAWIDYPSMSIAVQKVDSGYRCLKYVNNSIIRNTDKTFDTKDELENFLLELPSPPKEEIKTLISNLN